MQSAKSLETDLISNSKIIAPEHPLKIQNDCQLQTNSVSSNNKMTTMQRIKKLPYQTADRINSKNDQQINNNNLLVSPEEDKSIKSTEKRTSAQALLNSINSNTTDFIESSAKKKHASRSNIVQNDDNDVMSESNEQDVLAAQPINTQSSDSSFGDEENEAGGSIVPVIQQPSIWGRTEPDEKQWRENPINTKNVSGNIEIHQSPSLKVLQKSQPNSPVKRMELGGILVYDAYAKISGPLKLTKFYSQSTTQKVDPYILFSKEHVEKTTAELFSSEARERDFANDLDKQYYQRMPKYDMRNRELKAPYYTISVPPLHNMLIFESRFESGNLRKAAKVNNIEYNLWLENDLNTRGHTQWFYFKVVFQSDKPAKIQFNILNLAKTYSLYKAGMKPVVFSLKQFQSRFPKTPVDVNPLQNKSGWQRACDNIKYFQNDIARFNIDSSKFATNQNNDKFLQNHNGLGEGVENYYTLSFDYRFEHPGDEVWFAHAVPYTFTDMQNSIKSYTDNEQNSSILRTEILCNTIAGMPVPILTITDNIKTYITYAEQIRLQSELVPTLRKQYKQKYQQCRQLLKQSQQSKGKVQKLLEQAFEEEINLFYEQNQVGFTAAKFTDFGQKLLNYMKDHAHKRAIVLTSRVHPGEPQASFMLEGSLKMLLTDSDVAKELRKHFVFKIVPMLNPDGVIYGNYRCSLLGCDLNRKWLQPNKFLHPSIYYSKQMIRFLQWERKVTLYCDMHGHSRKQNVFFYGCSYKNYESEGRIKNAQVRILPLLCCHKNQSFSFAGSSFKIEKEKESTGRVVVFRDFNIMNSFTLECSFHGKKGVDGKITHMTLQDMIDIGVCLIEQLENYLPRESYKLNVIGSKVLDIFYDEFVKFLPAYILKREEEKVVTVPAAGVVEQNQVQQLQQNQTSQTQFKKKTIRKLQTKSTAITSGTTIIITQKKSSNLKTVQTVTKNEESSPDLSDADNISQNQLTPDQNFDFQQFNELEMFINNQFKKGKEDYDYREEDCSSSDEDDMENMFTNSVSNKQPKLPYIRNKKKVYQKNQSGSNQAQTNTLNYIETTLDKQQTLKQIKRGTNEKDQSYYNQTQQQIEKNPRIHPKIKTQYTDEYANFRATVGMIIEYVVDGKRIRVQHNQANNQLISPNAKNDKQQGILNEQITQYNRTTQGGNQLMTHGFLKRLPGNNIVQDMKGVKSFTEYAERIVRGAIPSSEGLNLQSQHSQSTYMNTQSPMKLTSIQKKMSVMMSQEQQSPTFANQIDSESEVNLNCFENKSIQKFYQEDQLKNPEQIRNKAAQIISQTQQNSQVFVTTQNTQSNRKTNLQFLAQQIKTGSNGIINEDVIEAHRKLTQMDRESIMSVGFQIKMRPPVKKPISGGQILTVKSAQNTKKRDSKTDQQKEMIQESTPVHQNFNNLKLVGSASQESQQYLETFGDQVQFGSPIIGNNGKPITALVCPINNKMQSSALKTHLKHKKNVQIPLPLHQQERLAAQEQNLLFPAQQYFDSRNYHHQKQEKNQGVVNFVSPRQQQTSVKKQINRKSHSRDGNSSLQPVQNEINDQRQLSPASRSKLARQKTVPKKNQSETVLP